MTYGALLLVAGMAPLAGRTLRPHPVVEDDAASTPKSSTRSIDRRTGRRSRSVAMLGPREPLGQLMTWRRSALTTGVTL